LPLDECGWEDVSIAFYTWSRAKASDAVAASSKAPAYDHTLNTGAGSYVKFDLL